MTSPGHDLAGMVHATGVLGLAPLAQSKPSIPAYLELEGEELIWALFGLNRDEWNRELDPEGMLDRFIRVSDAGGVLRFARRYGVLGLCEHGLPATHNPPPFASQAGAKRITWCIPKGFPHMCREPIDLWLHYSAKARALLDIAAEVHQGRLGKIPDWERVYERANKVQDEHREFLELLTTGTSALDASRVHLEFLTNEWLHEANVRPAIKWRENADPHFELNAGGSFGHIAAQLLMAVTRSQDLMSCDGCGYPYLRSQRRAQRGRRNFCLRCQGAGVPEVIRKRSQRQRQLGSK